jgi:hypothetical protein
MLAPGLNATDFPPALVAPPGDDIEADLLDVPALARSVVRHGIGRARESVREADARQAWRAWRTAGRADAPGRYEPRAGRTRPPLEDAGLDPSLWGTERGTKLHVAQPISAKPDRGDFA